MPKTVEGPKAHLEVKKDNEVISDAWVVDIRISTREDVTLHGIL